MIGVARRTLATLRRQALAGALSHEELAALAEDSRLGARRLSVQIEARRHAQADELERLARMLRYEKPLWRDGHTAVAGVDEVGVGPLAGPVVAAAVILAPGSCIAGVDDSKRLSAKVRARLDRSIRRQAAAWAIGLCSAQEIDAGNIFRATRQAARRAVLALRVRPQHVLVDAHAIPGVPMPQTAIVQGDGLSQSIAAASIVAKVARDAMMQALHADYPHYGFDRHVGYGTAAHLAALARLGPCPQHRRSFAPVGRLSACRPDACG